MVLAPLAHVMLALILLLPATEAVAAQIDPGERAYWPTAEWQTAPPEDQGMDPGLLAAADARIRADQPYITSLLVVRGGDLVSEQYYGGFTAADTTQIWSATKSFTSTLVGIAIDEGLLTLDQTVGELMPDRIPAEADPRAATVTVRQLLTMTSGFAWTSNTDYQFAYDAVDQTARTLGLPFACDPGTCYEYNSGNVQVLSSIIQALTGESLADYAQPRLFDPLGIAPPVWDAAVTGETLGAVGLHLTSRDVAKLGFLFLNRGVWDGQQVVSSEWVTAATSVQSSGVNAAGVSVGGGSTGYGYLWWTNATNGLPGYHAIGVGAQVLFVLPALDLVAVATTSNAIPNEVPINQQQDPKAIIEELIVPAVTGPVADPSTSTAAQVATPVVTEVATVAAALPTVTAVPVSPASLPAATPTESGRVFALPDGLTFPEGIAYDAATGDFFTGSVVDGTIGRGNVASGAVTVLLPGRTGLVAYGLALDQQGRLYVAGGQTGFIAVYDLTTGERLVDASNGLAPNTQLDDVAVTVDGSAYFTDSFNPILFRLPAGSVTASQATPGAEGEIGRLEVFLDLSAVAGSPFGEGFNATGIVATPDDQALLVLQSNTGVLYRVDLATRDVSQVDLGGVALTNGNDLALAGQTLYVTTGDSITVVELADDFTSGAVGVSVSDASFNGPTSLAVHDGCLLVVNSQFDQLDGDPALPFIVSSVPAPGVAGTPAAARSC